MVHPPRHYLRAFLFLSICATYTLTPQLCRILHDDYACLRAARFSFLCSLRGAFSSRPCTLSGRRHIPVLTTPRVWSINTPRCPFLLRVWMDQRFGVWFCARSFPLVLHWFIIYSVLHGRHSSPTCYYARCIARRRLLREQHFVTSVGSSYFKRTRRRAQRAFRHYAVQRAARIKQNRHAFSRWWATRT